MITCARCGGAILTGVTSYGGPICTCQYNHVIPYHATHNYAAEVEALRQQVAETQEMYWKKTADLEDKVAQQTEQLRVAKEALEDGQDLVSKAMRTAFQLGQTYWQQADSESWSQNKKADETQLRFDLLVDKTRDALAKLEGDGL